MDRLDYALKMAAAGLPVFPLRPNSKKPYEDEGITLSTTDANKIRFWFALDPGMNYGVDCTGRVVLDVDVKNGSPGMDTLETLGAIPDTLQVRSPSGGLHIYLDGMDAGQSPIGPGVDVRSHNGYVLGPGCYYKDRNPALSGFYEIAHDRGIAPIPEHIAERLREAAQRSAADAMPFGELDTETAVARARAYLERIEGAGQGGRDMTGFKVAAQLKDYGLSQDGIVAAMSEFWNYKNEPPLDGWELEKLARNAFAHGQNKPGMMNADEEFKGVDVSDLPEDPPTPSKRDKLIQEAKKLFRPLDLSRPPETVEPRKWLAKGLLLREHLTGLVAPGASGKSTVSLAIAICTALGDFDAMGYEFLGSAAPVVFVSTEEDEDEVFRRTWAYCKHHGINIDDVNGSIHWFGGERFVAMARDPQTKKLKKTLLVSALIEYVRDVGAALVVFDPLVELHEGDENDNSEIAAVMAALRGVVRDTGAAGLVCHHTRKGASDAGGVDMGRGAVAFVNNTRLMFTLLRASEEDAAENGMTPEVAQTAFRIDRGKGNYVAPGKFTKWYRTLPMAVPTTLTASTGRYEECHAMEMIDTAASREAVIGQYHTLLAPVLQGEDGDQITLAAAVRAVAEDPVLGNAADATLKKRLEKLFATPVSIGGYSIWLDLSDPNAARPRKMLRGGGDF